MSIESGSSAGLLRDILRLVIDEPRIAIGTAVVCLVILFIVDSLRAWYRLSHVPGPFVASFSRFWMLRGSMRAQLPMEMQAAVEKYGRMTILCNIHLMYLLSNGIGSLVRIGPNELATDDAKLLKKIHSGRSAYTRGPCM
jgi:hypothetical protein